MSYQDNAHKKRSKVAKASAEEQFIQNVTSKEPTSKQKAAARKPQKKISSDTANPSKTKPSVLSERPKTSPNLFVDRQTTRMAAALPIWEASSILTQRKHLPWDK